LPVQFERRRKRLANGPRNGGHVLAADGMRHVDGKFVSLQRRDRRFAKRRAGRAADAAEFRLQALAGLRQQGLASIAAHLFGGAREPVEIQHDEGRRCLESRLGQRARDGPVHRNHVRQAGAGIDEGRFAQQGVLAAQFPDCPAHARTQPAQFGKLHVAKVGPAIAACIIEIGIEPVERFAKARGRKIGNSPGTHQGHDDLDHQHDRRVRQFAEMHVHEEDAVTDLDGQKHCKNDQRHDNARQTREGGNGHRAENPAEESLLVQALIRFPGAIAAVPQQTFSEYV